MIVYRKEGGRGDFAHSPLPLLENLWRVFTIYSRNKRGINFSSARPEKLLRHKILINQFQTINNHLEL